MIAAAIVFWLALSALAAWITGRFIRAGMVDDGLAEDFV